MKFKYGDRVLLLPLDKMPGRVTNCYLDERLGHEYDVRYFNNSDAKNVRFFEDELTNG